MVKLQYFRRIIIKCFKCFKFFTLNTKLSFFTGKPSSTLWIYLCSTHQRYCLISKQKINKLAKGFFPDIDYDSWAAITRTRETHLPGTLNSGNLTSEWTCLGSGFRSFMTATTTTTPSVKRERQRLLSKGLLNIILNRCPTWEHEGKWKVIFL